MAFTQVEYDALKAAIASGELKVAYQDRTVTYRDLDEMERILYKMEAELFPAAAADTRRYASTSKGL